MERALIRLVFATLLLSCNASYIRAQESQEDIGPLEALAPYRSQEAAVPASLQDLYRRLAEYWEDENSRAIAHLVAPDGRVHVVVQQEGVGERRAAPQLQYLPPAMFASTVEVTYPIPPDAGYA